MATGVTTALKIILLIGLVWFLNTDYVQNVSLALAPIVLCWTRYERESAQVLFSMFTLISPVIRREGREEEVKTKDGGSKVL